MIFSKLLKPNNDPRNTKKINFNIQNLIKGFLKNDIFKNFKKSKITPKTPKS